MTDRDAGPGASDHRAKPHSSLAGRVTTLFWVLVVLAAAVAATMTLLALPPWSVFVFVLAVMLPVGAWGVHLLLKPLTTTLAGLEDGIRAFHDRDFSLRLAASGRRDEIGALARLYNDVADLLQEERLEARQRELLLQTAIDRSPVAIILVDATNDRVAFSNIEARRLLVGGAKIEGVRFSNLADRCPGAMRDVLASPSGGVFTVQGDDDHLETYHLAHRRFLLNRKRHTLVLLHRITADLGREEARVWKKVIRVISHELNNSLAPVSSLVHSARVAARRDDLADRADQILGTVEERVQHLVRFIDGYARFARLPSPRIETVDWADLVASLGEFPSLEIDGPLPTRGTTADRAQIQQLLVNLLKNAVEASEEGSPVVLRVREAPNGGSYVQVLDRGRGMKEEAMRQALLPFYSTKSGGTGLGLPLCREIVEAHGGKIALEARPGGGTVVTCWLPQISPAPDPPKSTSTPGDGTPEH